MKSEHTFREQHLFAAIARLELEKNDLVRQMEELQAALQSRDQRLEAFETRERATSDARLELSQLRKRYDALAADTKEARKAASTSKRELQQALARAGREYDRAMKCEHLLAEVRTALEQTHEENSSLRQDINAIESLDRLETPVQERLRAATVSKNDEVVAKIEGEILEALRSHRAKAFIKQVREIAGVLKLEVL